MATEKIAVSIDAKTLLRLDQLVREGRLGSRSRVVQEAIQEKVDRIDRGRLARECAKLDPKAEKRLAEEGLAQDLETWPEY